MFTLDRFDLKGRVAIITGAGGRGNSIGRAYAFGLANAGASVVIADLNAEGAECVAEEIAATGARTHAVRVDIADRASVDAMVEEVTATFGGIDILVNNAALMAELKFEPASTIALDMWNRIMTVNVTGALNCAQAALPALRASRHGRIINAVSGGAYPPQSVYGVSKLALAGLTTTLATELGRDNITVNAIAPGNTMSEAGKGLTPVDGPFRQKLDMNVVMRPTGEPDELVGALLLLASDAGAWITGQVLHVDGGWVLRP